MKCPSCGENEMSERTHLLEEEVAGVRFSAEVPVRACSACGELLFRGAGLEAFEAAVARRLAEAGPVSGEAFRFVRKAAGLRARDAAQLLGVTDVTVSRWENGAPVDQNAFVTLGSLLLDRLEGRDTTRERLRRMRERRPGDEHISL